MKELIIDILKTQLPMVKPEILSQIADDITELTPNNPIDAVEVLHNWCDGSSCFNCPFITPFGCGFHCSSSPNCWKSDELRAKWEKMRNG